MEKHIATLTELEDEAGRFVVSLTPRESGATLVTLSGELGAGKTAFVKAGAKKLGVTETVTSPTFVLEKIYPLDRGVTAFRRLVHIDAYRLESGKELSPLGLTDLLRDPETLIMLEWPEKVSESLPEAAARLTIVAKEDGSRTLRYA